MSPLLAFILIGCVATPFVFAWLSSAAKARKEEEARAAYRARKAELEYRFGEDNAYRIVLGDPWQGATQDMIRAMLGDPTHESKSVLKTKTKETWSYGQMGKRRYFAKVFFENGAVVGWEHK